MLVGLLCLLTLEGLVRLLGRPATWVNPDYRELSSGFAELEMLIENRQVAFSALKYYEEFLYGTSPVSTQYLNFTDYYSARLTPDSAPLTEAEHIIWAFGGSTMENQETIDALTIANTWARTFNHALGPTHVKNFGSGGFLSSYELIKFQRLLREIPTAELPDIVVFYDGYNEALFGFQYGPGHLQGDLSLKLEAVIEQDYLRLGAYALSKLLSRYSMLWERTADRFAERWLFPLPAPDASAENLAGAVSIYVSNVRMTRAVCDVFEISCFFILQPLLVTKDPLTALEESVLDSLRAHPRFGPEGVRFVRDFYRAAADELAGQEQFIDASAILDGREEGDFYDLGHVSAWTPPVIGKKTAALILARMDGEPSPRG